MRRYVVALDGSSAAQAAWRWARRRAETDGAACVLVHAAGESDHDSGPWPVGTVQLPSRAPEALARFVEPDDLLVIGTGKTGFVHGRLLGFTGVRIVAAAACTVVVVPELDLRFRSGVVVGVDRIETAAETAAVAATEAARRLEPIQVIRASGGEVDRRPGDVATAAEIAERVIRTGWPQLSVRTRVATRSFSAALLDAAATASLLVLDPGLSYASREGALPGAVALDVLVNATAPVLVLRSHDGDAGVR